MCGIVNVNSHRKSLSLRSDAITPETFAFNLRHFIRFICTHTHKVNGENTSDTSHSVRNSLLSQLPFWVQTSKVWSEVEKKYELEVPESVNREVHAQIVADKFVRSRCDCCYYRVFGIYLPLKQIKAIAVCVILNADAFVKYITIVEHVTLDTLIYCAHITSDQIAVMLAWNVPVANPNFLIILERRAFAWALSEDIGTKYSCKKWILYWYALQFIIIPWQHRTHLNARTFVNDSTKWQNGRLHFTKGCLCAARCFIHSWESNVKRI